MKKERLDLNKDYNLTDDEIKEAAMDSLQYENMITEVNKILNMISMSCEHFVEIPIECKRRLAETLEQYYKDRVLEFSQQREVTDDEIEEWAEKWELNDKVWEDTIMPYVKTGLKEGAKAMRDGKIGEQIK